MSKIPWTNPPDSGDAQMDEFLSALLDAVKNFNRDAVESLPSVSQTAGVTYTTTERDMLNDLKALANGLKTNL